MSAKAIRPTLYLSATETVGKSILRIFSASADGARWKAILSVGK
jgi:hypothetical protein